MASSNNRDVRLGIEIQTGGEDDVRRLAAAVRSLASEGSPAAAEFGRLAAELDRLADQSDAINSLQTLTTGVDKLTQAEREAALAADSASTKYREQGAALVGLREAQQRADAEARQARTALIDMNAALARSVIDAKAAGQSQREIAASTAEARLQIVDQGVALKSRNQALTDANAAVTRAEQSETRLRREFESTARAAASTGAALAEQSTALSQAAAAATALGVDITDLAAAQTTLLTAQRAYAQEAADTQRVTLANAEAARVAATAARELAQATEQSARAQREFAAAQAQSDADLTNLAAAIAYTRELAAEVDRLNAEEEALAATTREAAAALQRLENAAAADRVKELAASLREAETAARRFAIASEDVAKAGEGDVDTMQRRVRAAEALIASERELSAEEVKLAATHNAGRAALLAQAEALLVQQRAMDASAAASRRLVQESIALGTTADATGKALGRIGTLAEDAFGKVGVRSLQAIEKEIHQVDSAVSLLERSFRAGKISADDLARGIGAATVKLNQLQREASQVQSLPGVFERISTSVNGLLSKFGALGAAIATVGVAVKPVIDATVALEQMRRVLTTVTGSAESAQKQIEFLRTVSRQSGQQFDELGVSYAKFAASALQSGLSIKQTQDVFKSVALAAGNLGLSSDQAKRALEALSQIASKGVVSMEELRQQLGDALPGVLPLLAKELGLTQIELNKVVESGQLLATEAIPAIGRSLTALQAQDGKVDGLTASWNRFINVVKEAGTTLVDGPIGQAAGVVLTALAGVLRDVAVVAVGASEAFKLFGLSTLAVLDALRGNTTFDELKKSLSDFAQQSGDRLAKFEETAYGTSEATKKLGTDVVGLGTSFAKLSLDQQKAIDAAALQAQSSEKHVQAVKAEAEAIGTLAALVGDETTARLAAVEAAAAVLRATELQLAADQRVVGALVETKAATEAKAAAEGVSRDAIKATIEALDIKIGKATADVEKTNAAVTAARAHAAAMSLAAEAALDNSKRLDELRAAVEAATQAQIDVAKRYAEGKASLDQLKASAEALAKAKGLLRDAINDVSEALERELALMRADAKLAEAGIKLEIERAKNAQTAALAEGNVNKARQDGIRIRELEISLLRSGTTLKLSEAEATLRSIATQQKELELLGQLTPEKKADLEVRRKIAEASVLEASTAIEANRSKENDLRLTKEGTLVRRDYNERVREGRAELEGETQSLDRNTSSRGASNKALDDEIRRRTELKNILASQDRTQTPAGNASGNYNDTVTSNSKPNTYDKDGFATDDSGQRIVIEGQVSLKEGQFFDKAAFDKAVADYNRAIGGLTAIPGSIRAPDPQKFVRDTPTIGVTAPAPAPAPSTIGGRSGSGSSASPSSAPALSSTTHTVNLSLNGGQTTTVKVNSTTDAAALQDFLIRLAQSQQTAATP